MKAEPCRNRFCKSYHPKALAYCQTCKNTVTRAHEDVKKRIGQ